MSTAALTPDQFAEKIKQKYPEYQSIPNADLTQRIIAKYPQYKDQVNFSQPASTTEQAPAYQRAKDSFLSAIGVTNDEGAKKFFLHPIQTFMDSMNAQGDLAVQAKEAYKRGDYQSAVQHGLNYMLPFIGQNTDKAGEQLKSGDIAGGIGTTLGTAAPIIAPEAKAAVSGAVKTAGSRTLLLGRTPEGAYESALKPSTTLAPEARAAMVKTGLENKIPVSAGGLEKISALVDDLNTKIKQTIDTGTQQGATVNKFKVASRLGDTYQQFKTQVNPAADLQAVSKAGNEFLRNQPAEIPASEAQSLKQGTYRQLKGKAYGELKSATIESQKALARGIKEELAQQFPELSGLNRAESQLLNLEPQIERAIGRQANHQMVGIGTPIVAAGAKAVTKSNAAAAAIATIKAVVDNPVIKSKLAIALYRKGVPMQVAQSRIAAYSSALAAASTSEQTNGQEGQQ